MNPAKKIKIFLVDDDVVFLKALEIEFKQHEEFDITTFVSGELCIASMAAKPDVVTLDYQLDGTTKGAMNGINTLDELRKIDPNLAVIMLSSQDKIEVAIDCMHHQALDYVVKSETAFIRLQKIIASTFTVRKMEKELTWYIQHV